MPQFWEFFLEFDKLLELEIISVYRLMLHKRIIHFCYKFLLNLRFIIIQDLIITKVFIFIYINNKYHSL